MNDLERALSDLLHSKAAAADRPVALLDGVERRVRYVRRQRRVAASVLAAAGLVVAAVVPLALWTLAHLGSLGPASPPMTSPPATPTSPGPKPTTPAIPADWAPVPYGDVQVSVPADWGIQAEGGGGCGGGASGVVYVGVRPKPSVMRAEGCLVPNVIELLPDPNHLAPGGSPKEINGIDVFGGRTGRDKFSYLVPRLGVELVATGPLASKVVATLTTSPLSVVLAGGPPSRVPASWRRVAFGGISLAVPPSLRLQHETVWGRCVPSLVVPGVVQLNSARSALDIVCGGGIAFDAGALAGRDGVVIGSGPAIRAQEGPVSCGRRSGLRICLVQPAARSALTLSIRPAGRGRPTLVIIGLAGTGLTARTIFDSIEPARPQ